jgi:thiol-disulfide isomerase/thioredoxin
MAILLALLASLSLGATELESEREAAGLLGLREPTRIIDFTLEDLSGRTVSLSAFEGKVVLLNFWATWCGPCRAEIPSMQALYEELSPQGFEIVAVNLREPVSRVSPFVEQYGMTFPVLLDTTGEIGSVYGASSIPTTYVIDRRGFAVSGIIGSIEWDTQPMRTYLASLLAQ